MTAGFPTFIEWLADHPDEALTAIRPTALHDVTDVASLRSIDLLVLHAAAELDAMAQPATVSEVMETAEELLNIAGTPLDLRPHQEELTTAFAKLASHGFIYGPKWRLSAGTFPTDPSADIPGTWELKIAPTVASYFDPTTSEAWALADHHRSPIPTANLPQVVEDLPARQRRLIQTLHSSGGVGHSASVGPDGDPSAPLPTMVREGLLDQLDDTTVRLTGRVGQYLDGAVISGPGGDFRPTSCPHYQEPAQTATPSSPHSAEPAEAPHPLLNKETTTDTAVSNAVQTILEITELLLDISRHPLEPLTNGGIGLRSLAKTAKRLHISDAELTDRLTLAIETGLIATGYLTPSSEEYPSTYWGLTAAGKNFLESHLADQWAQLLVGWTSSSYAPWEADHQGVREFEPPLFQLRATRTRQCFPFCFSTPPASPMPEPNSAPSVPQTMWRVNPAVAHFATDQMWTALFSEARKLGLLVDKQPAISLDAITIVLTAPAGTDPTELRAKLSENLAQLLPEPVKFLIIQSDHTVMAPGLLSPEDSKRLRSIAVQESNGIASVWRISTEAVLRAYAAGTTRQEIEEFLAHMTPGGWSAVPQSLQYTIADAERLYQNSTDSPVPIATKSPSYTVVSITHPESTEEEDFFWRGEWETIMSAVEHQRQLENEAHGASGASTTRKKEHNSALYELAEIKQALRKAMKLGQAAVVRYANGEGESVEKTIEVVMAEPARVTGVEVTSRETIQVQVSHIEWVRLDELS